MQAVVKKVVYSFRYRPGPGEVGREVFPDAEISLLPTRVLLNGALLPSQ